jgi:hypothetical protein
MSNTSVLARVSVRKQSRVVSEYGYFSGYTPRIMDIDWQITLLREIFPGLGNTNPEYLKKVKYKIITLPRLAEKFAAIPNYRKCHRLFGYTYNEALQKALDVLRGRRKFVGGYQDHLDAKRLRQSVRSIEFWDRLIEEQGNPDILIVPIQFGDLYSGLYINQARRVIAKMPNEFGLGAFAVCTMLLTHPERLMNDKDLCIDCSGDEFDNPSSCIRFDRAPFFYFVYGFVGFNMFPVNVIGAKASHGAASGFIIKRLAVAR